MLGKNMIAIITGKKTWFTCVICEGEFSEATEWAHNAEPVAKGKCCGYCNDFEVIPARFKQAFKTFYKNKMEKNNETK